MNFEDENANERYMQNLEGAQEVGASELMPLLALLYPALEHGCRFEVFNDSNGVTSIDLNTGAKSGCTLKLENGQVIAYRRYGRVDQVSDFDELLWLVHDCAHGRGYFDEGWLNVFECNDLSDPRGSL